MVGYIIECLLQIRTILFLIQLLLGEDDSQSNYFLFFVRMFSWYKVSRICNIPYNNLIPIIPGKDVHIRTVKLNFRNRLGVTGCSVEKSFLFGLKVSSDMTAFEKVISFKSRSILKHFEN